MTGPHQSSICCLTSRGHGAAEWTTVLEAGGVVAIPCLARETEQAVELGRHHVGSGHPVGLDQAQRLLRVEPSHDHQRLPDVQGTHVEAVRPAVVHRRRHQMASLEGAKLERPPEHRRGVGHLPGRARREGPADPLRLPRRTGRVGEQRAGRPLRRLARREPLAQPVQRINSGRRTDRQDGDAIPRFIQYGIRDHRRELLVDDEHLRPGVGNDPGHLACGQERVQWHEVPACLLTRQRALHHIHAIGQHRRHHRARLRPRLRKA